MKELRIKIRNLIADYEDEREELEEQIQILEARFHSALEKLQSKCPHKNISDWEFFLNDYNEIAMKNDALVQRRECPMCGKLEYRTYDGIDEIEFKKYE